MPGSRERLHVAGDVGGRWGLAEAVRFVPSGGGSLHGKRVPTRSMGTRAEGWELK